MLPAASPPPPSRQTLQVADGGVQSGVSRDSIDVYVVDDDIEHANSFARLLRSRYFSVRAFQTIQEFLSTFSGCNDAIILCDAHMPDGGAERLLSILSARQEAPRFAVVSGDATDEYLYKLAALGAQAFFAKPVTVDDVVRWIRSSGRGGSPNTAQRSA
jgi:FixJ family two-component response regulator